MNESAHQQKSRRPEETPSRRRARRWHWQAIVAVILALAAVEGQPVAASYATASYASAGPHARTATVARQLPRPASAVTASTSEAPRAPEAVRQTAATGATAATAEQRPDFRISFLNLDDAEAGSSFSYTIQVRNDGGAIGAASVGAVLPPDLSNVRVIAPGFVCTRRFTASGPEAGTLVSCMRSDLESGAAAEITVEANVPNAAGAYRLTAVVDPRDEVAESDEANNEADVTILVRD